MKKTAKTELRSKSVQELRAMADGLRREMLMSRFASASEGKRLGVKYRSARHQVARIETIIGEKMNIESKKG